MSKSEEHAAMVERALDAIPGYPFLPCPICHGIEGCDHGVVERATAYANVPEPYRVRCNNCGYCYQLYTKHICEN